jgi:hypothetical protein
MFNNLLPLGIQKTRDPIFSSLEDEVYSKLEELTKDDILSKTKKQNKFVSFEEAVKELLKIKKSAN